MAAACCIKVACRIRPLNSKEKSSGSQFVVSFPTDNCLSLGNKVFNFDRVFKPESSQEDVYKSTALPLVKDVLCGYNSTIFAYGQTSSGKTHTMEGELGDPDLQGITPRIVNEIFEQIYTMDNSLEFQIKVSYFELYMERIRDLLDVTKVNLPIHENKKKVPYVKGITERFVTMPEEVMAVIEEGKASRHVSVTNMNAHSSRSHAIFLISIRQENKETHHTLTGKLFLVDLAGSEKVEKTNAQGLTLEEAKGINKSLLALSNVISSLSEGSRSHIPYRDSKLTRVLQESLGGNARTTLIICCSPSSYNESESKSTLMFGERAKTIKNKVEINVELTPEEWRKRYDKLKEEYDQLKRMLATSVEELTKWRNGSTVPVGEQVSLKDLNTSSSSSSSKQQQQLSTKSSTASTSTNGNSSVPAQPQTVTANIKELEEENMKLCQQLDDKDDELHKQTSLVEELKLKIAQTEERMEVIQEESSLADDKLSEAEKELSRSQDEVGEVMKALEELALSYDTKDTCIRQLEAERDTLTNEIQELQSKMILKDEDIQILNNAVESEKRRNRNSMVLLFKELNEMGGVLGTQLDGMDQVLDSDWTEESFTRVRIYLSNMKVEARSLTEQRQVLEQAERGARVKAEAAINEVNTLKLKLLQNDSMADDLQATLTNVTEQKSELESSLDDLQEQLLKLKVKETELSIQHKHHNEQTQLILDDTLTRQQETHKREIESLKTDIEHKGQNIVQLQSEYQKLQQLNESLKNDIAQLESQQIEFSQLSERLAVKEKIEHEYSGITDTVKSELSQLDTLRQTLFKTVIQRMQSPDAHHGTLEGSMDSTRPGDHRAVDELTRAYKKSKSLNSELQREILKYKSESKAKSQIIEELEKLLKDTKTAALKEHQILNKEMERMKTSYIDKLKEREKYYTMYRKQGPSIVRPVIRPRDGKEAGSQPSSAPASRDALLAFAGVQRLNQTKRSPLLQDNSQATM